MKGALTKLRRQRGQGLPEYALILALVAVAAIAAMGTLGNKTKQTFQNVSSQL